MSDYRVILTIDMTAANRQEAAAYAREIAIRLKGERRRVNNRSAREGGYEGSHASIWGTDIVEVRDR